MGEIVLISAYNVRVTHVLTKRVKWKRIYGMTIQTY